MGSFFFWTVLSFLKKFLPCDQAPVGRIFFTGEHTSERFSGYVHGGYLAGKQNWTLLELFSFFY